MGKGTRGSEKVLWKTEQGESHKQLLWRDGLQEGSSSGHSRGRARSKKSHSMVQATAPRFLETF